jgi:ribosome maturation factor RimP
VSEERRQALADARRAAGEVAAGLGVEVVEFTFHSQGRHSFLRIDIDRPGIPGAGLAECESFSRALGARIEDLTFFESAYELQVSTPGVDRPIRTDDDIRRNTGRRVRVEFRDELGRVREVTGALAGLGDGEAVRLRGDHGETLIGRSRIVLMRQDVALGGGRRKGRR